MDKFKNKYRINSVRLKGWDYSSKGYYYITICTKNKIDYFGNIICRDAIHRVSLSKIGEIAKQYWLAIPKYHPYVELDEFIIMPNHIHGIIHIVETPYMASPNNMNNKNKFGPQSKNIASIVRGYKSSITKWSKIKGLDFSWHAGFYDHIMRNNQALEDILKYILNNSANWENYEG